MRSIPALHKRLQPLWLGLATAIVLPACGDPPLSERTPPGAFVGSDTSRAASDASASGAADADTSASRTAPDAISEVDSFPGDTPSDSAAAPIDAAPIDAAPIDAAPIDAAPIDSGWHPPDIDTSALELVKSEPPDGGQLPGMTVTFDLYFSAPLLDAGVQPYTIMVSGPGGDPLPGGYKVDGARVHFQADKPSQPHSPIDVLITTMVHGSSGRTLAGPVKLRLYTGGYGDMERWRKLALRHAPTFWLQTGPHWLEDEAPRALDFAGWDLDQTDQHLPAHPSAPIEVAWTVSTTRSHHFVHYVLYWPHKPKTDRAGAFYNDTAGYTVVVRADAKERTEAVISWFKRGDDEQMWAWVRQGAVFVPPGASADKLNVRAIAPQLGEAFLPAGDHQACLWQDDGDQSWQLCVKHAAALAQMRFVKLVPSASATVTPPSGSGAKADASPPHFGYTLAPLHAKWWPHRADPSLHALPMTFSYKPPAGRPGVPGAMGSRLRGGSGPDFGRPPWAWRWKPTTNVSYYDLPRGTPFFDPAWALYQRMGGAAGGVKDWDPKAGRGLSMLYCFSPVLGLDLRATPECKAALPPK